MADAETSAPPKDPTATIPKASTPPPESTTTHDVPPQEGEEDMLLVSEFPPPPPYYALASRNIPINTRLVPPDIPLRAFRVAAKKVLRQRKRVREESEQIRSAACASDDADGTSSITDGKTENEVKTESHDTDDDSIDPDNPNEKVVAVFGEIVEDPTLTMELECDDPSLIQENVKRLNQEVLKGFLKLVRVLVTDPNENKKVRDELSHNLFLMIQECNKFREHQAREILIATLEQQLKQREEGLDLLKKEIGDADDSLNALKQSTKEN